MLDVLVFAADTAEDDGGISVSVVGMIIGLLLGLAIYLIGDWLAKREMKPVIRTVAIIIAVIVFLVLGFDVYGELDT